MPTKILAKENLPDTNNPYFNFTTFNDRKYNGHGKPFFSHQTEWVEEKNIHCGPRLEKTSRFIKYTQKDKYHLSERSFGNLYEEPSNDSHLLWPSHSTSRKYPKWISWETYNLYEDVHYSVTYKKKQPVCPTIEDSALIYLTQTGKNTKQPF